MKKRQRERFAGVQSQNCDVTDKSDSLFNGQSAQCPEESPNPNQAASPSTIAPSATSQYHSEASPTLQKGDTFAEIESKAALDSPPQPKQPVPVPPTPEASDPELQSASQSSKGKSIKEGCSFNVEDSGGKCPTEKAAAHGVNANPSAASPSNKRQRAKDQHVETDNNDTKYKRRRIG